MFKRELLTLRRLQIDYENERKYRRAYNPQL